MESFRQFSDDCIEEGCTSVALHSKYCLLHGKKRRQENGDNKPNVFKAGGGSSRSRSGSGFSKPAVKQDSPQHLRRTRTEEQSIGGQSRPWRRNSRDESNLVSSTGSQATVRKSNLPPDLVGRIAMTARKSTCSPVSSKKRTEMMSSSFHDNPASTHTSGFGSPTTHQSPVSVNFNPFQSFINTAYTPSPNNSTNEMPADFATAAEERNQGRASKAGPGLGFSSSNTSPATHTSQVSQTPLARPDTDKSTPLADSLDHHWAPGGWRSESISKDSVSASTPSGGSRSFDSLPYVRTNRLPPVQLKSVPSASRSASRSALSKAAITSASKRKRAGSYGSTSQSSSPDEIDGDKIQVLPHMRESNAVNGEAQTTATVSTTSQRPNGVFDIHSGVSQTQRQWNGPNMFRTRAALNPIVLSSSDDEDEEDGMGSNGNVWQVNPFYEQSRHAIFPADGEYLRNANRPPITSRVDHQRTDPDQPRRKLNCEERRLQLCATFDSVKFDAMLYGQAEATRPPDGVLLPSALINNLANAQPSAEGREQFYMKLDPRIHWSHNRSEQWYNLKMEEIKARGGRKANFGKAAQRMLQQRLEGERRDEEEKRAIEQGLPVPINKPPQPWSHHRHMDFGDVPEEELPAYVRKNPEWLQATAWMRQNREQTLHRNKEAATLRAAGLPWEHLFSRSGR